MVIVKFKKINEGVFFEKKDIERIMKRILLLSGINSKFQVELIGATLLGVESLCEFMEVKTSLASSDIQSAIEHNFPSYFQIESVFETDKELSKRVLIGQYRITFAGDVETVEVEKVLKKEPTQTLRSFEMSNDGVICLVEDNAEKVKKLISKIESAAKGEIEIVKEELYFVDDSGEIVEIDEA